MGIKNTVFFLDLKTLSSKPDSKLKAFAKSEDLEVEDIIKIIYAEAERIKEEDKVKVTFKIIDDDEDSFRVIVESANVKYKGTIIYPYEKIKSDDFEFVLDSVCGTITLVNKKADCKKISVTIDGAALDIFSMKYKEAKDFLKELSDRKGKKGYIEYPDGICFKHFGIKLNAQKAENGDVLVDSKVASINVYNQEEFDKAFYFEPEKQEKYDVNIPLPDEYNYEKKETKKKKTIVVEKEEDKKEEVKEVEEAKIEIELPVEKSKEELEKEAQEKREKEDKEREEQRKKNQEELDLIRKRQEEELEKVKEKFRRELEEDINKNIQKYEEEKLEKVELPDSIKEEKVKEIKNEEPEITGPIIVNPITPKVEEVEEILQEDDEEEEIEENNIPHKDGFAELQKKFKILTDELDEEDEDNTQEDFEDEEIEQIEPQTIKQPEEDFDIKDLDEVLGRTRKEEPKEAKDNDNEIEVLEKMLEEGKRQQEILEQRITAKLEELKAQVKAKEEPKKEEIKEEVKETKKTAKKEVAKASLQDLEREIEDLEEEIIEPKAAPKKETKKAVKKEEKVEEKVEENENSIRSYTLESYKGLIDNSTNTLIVYFGQSKKDIRKILGKPKQIRDFEEMELYEDFYVYYDEEDKCVGIGLYNDKKYETTLSLSMFDRNLIDMKYRHIVKLIKRNDPNSIEDDDGIISLKYGISVDPREEKDSADDICDVIHIFQKGYYDEVYENF